MDNNPYDAIESAPSSITFSKRTAIIVVCLFTVGLLVMPIWRHIAELQKPKQERWLPIVEIWKPSGQKTFNQFFAKKSKNPAITREKPNLRDHLQAVEAGIKDSSIRKQIQQSEQARLSAVFKKGSNKVVQGKDSWLYLRPGIEALTGRGPLKPIPDNVANDPDQPPWTGPLEVIDTFHRQLQDRDIELMLVPIPVKPMLEQDGLGLAATTITHPDQEAFYQQLRSKGIEVIDILPTLEKLKAEGQTLYLKQDTHWRAEVAKAAAIYISDQVKQKDWYPEAEKYPAALLKPVKRTALGDLVEMLDLPEGTNRFTTETQQFERVLDLSTGRALENNLHSPIGLLGDSFINIYEEPGLGFGDISDQGLIGAGFGSHLSAALKLRPHIMAINGEGATGVRQAFASLPDNIVKERKLVIWAFAYRDLFLSGSAASKAGVSWQDVEFNSHVETIEPPIQPTVMEPTDATLVVSAVLSEKSVVDVKPESAPYSEAIFTAVFKDIEVISGEYYDDELLVYLWAFQDNKWTKESSIEPGNRYQLKLTPLTKRPAIARKKRFSDFTLNDLEHFFSEEINYPNNK